MYLSPNCCCTFTLKFCEYASRKFTSKIDRVVPEGARFGSTPGGAGRPLDSVRSVPNVDRTSVDCRNGGFCAFDDEVPPGVKFQNTP